MDIQPRWRFTDVWYLVRKNSHCMIWMDDKNMRMVVLELLAPTFKWSMYIPKCQSEGFTCVAGRAWTNSSDRWVRRCMRHPSDEVNNRTQPHFTGHHHWNSTGREFLHDDDIVSSSTFFSSPQPCVWKLTLPLVHLVYEGRHWVWNGQLLSRIMCWYPDWLN